MSADTIPSEVPSVGSAWVKKPKAVTVAASIGPGVSYVFDGGSGEATLSRFLQEYEPADRSTRPAEPAEPTVDTIAAFLHKEVEWPEDNYPAYTWPEVDGDTGQRDGGYVKIVPKYVVEEFRGIARRLLIAFRQEGAVSAEPAAPVAEAGDGDVAASLAHLNIGYLYGIADALERTYPTRAGDIRQCLLQVVKGLSTSAATLEAERARADAAEQRAADALARAEKAAEDERDRLLAVATELADRPNTTIGWKRGLETVREFLKALGATLPAAREAQPATDGGDNG